MTESEWWSATNFDDAWSGLAGHRPVHRRKMRLLGVAAISRARHLLDEAGVRLLRTLEAYSDGQASEHLLRREWAALPPRRGYRSTYAPQPHEDVRDALRGPSTRSDSPSAVDDWYSFALFACDSSAEALSPDDLAPDPDFPHWPEFKPDPRAYPSERLAQVRLLHDIFGPLPFRDISPDPEWLTSDVLALARGIYEEKAFDRMPILADALQDAGCANGDVLSHCRAENWEHVRGCWVIDLLLGRPWREEH